MVCVQGKRIQVGLKFKGTTKQAGRHASGLLRTGGWNRQLQARELNLLPHQVGNEARGGSQVPQTQKGPNGLVHRRGGELDDNLLVKVGGRNLREGVRQGHEAQRQAQRIAHRGAADQAVTPDAVSGEAVLQSNIQAQQGRVLQGLDQVGNDQQLLRGLHLDIGVLQLLLVQAGTPQQGGGAHAMLLAIVDEQANAGGVSNKIPGAHRVYPY